MTFNHGTMGTILGAPITIPCIIITSLIKSMVFPIAHHLGTSTQADKVGSSVSKVYFANIMGSTLGPLVTGLFLLNVASLQTAMMVMAALTIFTGVYCKFVSGTVLSRRIAFGAFLLAPLPLIIPQNLTHILVSNLSPHGEKVKQIVENRYGIIHALENKKGGDVVYGGNVYDGKINIDFVKDSNHISRVYGLATLKPSYERILVIGLSAGSWTRVLQSFPGVRKIDAVELNPGYLEITKNTLN